MHELGLASALIDAVERRAQGRPVAKVRVRVGRLHHVHPESFDQSFVLAAMGTVAEGAAADVVYVDVKVRCQGCGAEAEAEQVPFLCDACGGSELAVVSGDQLLLESIEYRAIEEG